MPIDCCRSLQAVLAVPLAELRKGTSVEAERESAPKAEDDVVRIVE
jgi:hypothetical protein